MSILSYLYNVYLYLYSSSSIHKASQTIWYLVNLAT